MQQFASTVEAPSAITSSDSTTFTVGTAGAFTVTTTGYPVASLSETGALPDGVTFADNGDGTASLSGTPSAATGGTYPITVHASNSVGSPDAQSFALTVDEASTITSGASATFDEGSDGSYTVTTAGYPSATLSENGTLPSGVTFMDNGDGTATLAGTPANGSGGSYPISISASNGVGQSASQSFTLEVNSAPSITSAAHTTFTAGTAGSFTVTSTGGPTPSLSEAGALPDGVTFTDNGDGSATLAGTAALDSADTYSFTIDASNGVSPDASQGFTLTVRIPAAITTPDHASFGRYSASSFTVVATGNPTPTLTEVGNLPKGLAYAHGTISGTPTKLGTFQLSFLANNGVGNEAVQYFTLTITPFQVTTTSLPPLTEASPYSQQLAASGGVAPYKWKAKGTLPNGLTLSKTGLLSGTVPAGSVTPGTVQIPIKVTDSKSPTKEVLTVTLSLTINA